MVFEAKIIEFLQTGASEFWIYFFRIFTLLGSWLGFVLALLFLFFKKKKLSYVFFGTYLAGVGVNTALKYLITRPRPFVSWETILNLGEETGFSMPSGHANSSAMIAVFIAFFAIKYSKKKATKIIVPILMALYVLFICFSRLFLGAHYLTDVLAGTAEGAIVAMIGLSIWSIFEKREKKDGKTSKT